MSEQSLKNALRVTELEGELQQLHGAASQMREFLAGALCCGCGEPLGQTEELMNADGRTFHKKCEKAVDDFD